jgi:hypothetical protein
MRARVHDRDDALRNMAEGDTQDLAQRIWDEEVGELDLGFADCEVRIRGI